MQRASQWCTTTQHFSNFPKDCLKQAWAHSPKAPWKSYFRFRGPVSLCHKQTGASALSTMKNIGRAHTKISLPADCKTWSFYALHHGVFLLLFKFYSFLCIRTCVNVCLWVLHCAYMCAFLSICTWKPKEDIRHPALFLRDSPIFAGMTSWCSLPGFCFVFKAGARDLNSGPHAHRAKTLFLLSRLLNPLLLLVLFVCLF